MKKKLDKASVHNGRANSKGVAYNANHNTLELSGAHQPRIAPDCIHHNRCVKHLDGGAAIAASDMRMRDRLLGNGKMEVESVRAEHCNSGGGVVQLR